MDKELLTKDGKPMRDLTVKIRVEDTAALTEENYKRIKACIQFMEKEYGDNHTLSFKVEFSV